MNDSSANAEQIAYWNGRAGASWTDLHDRTDEMFTPITAALMTAVALGPGEHVLDVGCGCGETTLCASDAVGPAGSVVGLDVSEPMLGRAKMRSAGRTNVEWRLEDAARAAFTRPFDAIVSRFGVMFFTDPVAAFGNLRAALAPGGRIVFVCWQDVTANDWAVVPSRAARPFLGDPAPSIPGAPGPFAFADRDRLTGILQDAGFVDVAIAPRTTPLPMGRDPDDALAQLARIGPLARAVAELDPDVARRALEAARDEVVARAAGGPLELGGAYWLVSARCNS